MNGIFKLIAAACLSAVASFASAGDRPVLIELFTSQGCSSCPPADDFLAELAKRDDVIPLSFHVDYWDYIGWKDTFADPRYTNRQQAYARAGGRRMVYTPQMIIGGVDHVEGHRPMQVMDKVQAHRQETAPVSVTIAQSGSGFEIRMTADKPLEQGAVVQLVRYRDKDTVKIRRGENAGRTITYHNIVAEIVEIGKWNGKGDAAFKAKDDGETNVVAIVQARGHGPVLGTALFTR